MVQVIVSYQGSMPLIEEVVTSIGKVYGAEVLEKLDSEGISEIEFMVKDHEFFGFADVNSERFVNTINHIPTVNASIEETDIL